MSIVVPQSRWPMSTVSRCLQGLLRATPEIPESFEVIVPVSSRQPAAARSDEELPVRWLPTKPGCGFAGEVRAALAAARFDWVYLLDAGMEMEPGALAEALRWRAPHVFAVGSRIVGSDATGWNDAATVGDVIVPFAISPEESGCGRGNLFADSRAALFRRDALRALLPRTETYLGPRWNDVEWGMRAWRAGLEVLFCPNSRVRQVSERPSQDAAAKRRDQLQLDLRNAWTRVAPDHLAEMAQQGDERTHAGLWESGNVWQVFLSRLKTHAAQARELPWSQLRRKYYPAPWRRRDPRPTVLVVAPYALFPPTHGGAHRIHQLLKHIAQRYRVILLTDEGQSYGDDAAAYFADFGAVHFVGGRSDRTACEPARIARMRSHAHEGLGNELSRLLSVYRPDVVQIEYIELALLARWKTGRTPWILTLHDVLLSGAARASREDRFEMEWMGKFDHLIACCEEDASLLRGMPVSLVPNGAEIGRGGYTPSAGHKDVLFLGPFRYQPNWDGIQEFLRTAYPALRALIPEIRVHILGGVDARLRAAGCEAFGQSGVCVHDHVDDVAPWLEKCALTINPIRNNRGSCLKVVQSLALGRVCVSTREGARGFLDGGLRGLVVVDTVAEFAAEIARLLNDEEERLRLEAPDAGKLERYSWERAAEAQMALYERVTGRPGVCGMAGATDFLAARTPRILWVELTSKCPFDCIFCSRQTRRGAGRHLPFETYASLLDGLVDARKFVLNYSGESTVYPDLIPAIQRARATGAFVEMVSVMAAAPESLLGPLSRSGLNRLTVSVHATNAEKFQEVYRHGSFATLRSRLERFLDLCRTSPGTGGARPAVDLAFVAMDTNLAELDPVAALAGELGLHIITICPVMRRDEIPAEFPSELAPGGVRRPEFERRMRAAVLAAGESHPQVRITVSNEPEDASEACLGEVPVRYSRQLPEGAWIHSCEQNPWETAHVLSNGDVVACEVLDKIPLGNLLEQSIGEIWHGPAYRAFRERYRRGEVAECRACPWKVAYLPGSRSSEIIAARGLNAQLLYGWHPPDGEAHIWSSQQAALVLAARAGSRILHLSGMLPQGPAGNPNQLTIRLNGTEIGQVTNPWDETMPFGMDFAVGAAGTGRWVLDFRTTQVFRPSERGVGSDQRDLGFALVLAVAKGPADPERAQRRMATLEPLRRTVHASDRWGESLRRGWHRAPRGLCGERWKPGLSILIPEWDNAPELAACLESVREAGCQWSEPLEVVVVVNGSPESDYLALRKRHPEVRWRFYGRPLGFGGAVHAGLRSVRHDWVYLLNSDAMLEASALDSLSALRSAGTFSVASQIVLKDKTRFRDETNWTTLLVESGLAAIHDWIPRRGGNVPNFYAGGGASLFRTCLLRKLLEPSAYHPFYWEDVELGWRARKLGYESVFCPASIAYHGRRSTIGRHYPEGTVERIVHRNRLLFQLRNFTTAGSLERAMEEIASAPDELGAHFLAPATRGMIARGRLWNHLAPLTDEEVFALWNDSISNC